MAQGGATQFWQRHLLGSSVHKGMPFLCERHLRRKGHSFEDSNIQILEKEDRWFERGVKETVTRWALSKQKRSFVPSTLVYLQQCSDVSPPSFLSQRWPPTSCFFTRQVNDRLVFRTVVHQSRLATTTSVL